MRDDNDPMNWEKLVPHLLHPMQLAAIEAMRWIDEPFSSVDLDRMHEDPPGVSGVAYHLRALAYELPVLRLYEEETIRGSTRKIYFFRKRTPASRRRKRTA